MNIKNLGVNDLKEEDIILNIDGAELVEKEELLKENEALQKQIDEAREKEEEDMSNFIVDEVNKAEDRQAKALEILEKEKQLQLERELEWKKEKRNKKIARTVKLVVIVGIVAVLGIAYKEGYRIPLPESVVEHMEGIWDTASQAVIKYFTTK